MINPIDCGSEIKAIYTGETFKGAPHGIGHITWGHEKGYFSKETYNEAQGYFREGQLDGQAYISEKCGWRGSYHFVKGVREGHGRLYYEEGSRGKVSKQSD